MRPEDGHRRWTNIVLVQKRGGFGMIIEARQRERDSDGS